MGKWCDAHTATGVEMIATSEIRVLHVAVQDKFSSLMTTPYPVVSVWQRR